MRLGCGERGGGCRTEGPPRKTEDRKTPIKPKNIQPQELKLMVFSDAMPGVCYNHKTPFEPTLLFKIAPRKYLKCFLRMSRDFLECHHGLAPCAGFMASKKKHPPRRSCKMPSFFFGLPGLLSRKRRVFEVLRTCQDARDWPVEEVRLPPPLR